MLVHLFLSNLFVCNYVSRDHVSSKPRREVVEGTWNAYVMSDFTKENGCQPFFVSPTPVSRLKPPDYSCHCGGCLYSVAIAAHILDGHCRSKTSRPCVVGQIVAVLDIRERYTSVLALCLYLIVPCFKGGSLAAVRISQKYKTELGGVNLCYMRLPSVHHLLFTYSVTFIVLPPHFSFRSL